jgi:hypothetical protein
MIFICDIQGVDEMLISVYYWIVKCNYFLPLLTSLSFPYLATQDAKLVSELLNFEQSETQGSTINWTAISIGAFQSIRTATQCKNRWNKSLKLRHGIKARVGPWADHEVFP